MPHPSLEAPLYSWSCDRKRPLLGDWPPYYCRSNCRNTRTRVLRVGDVGIRKMQWRHSHQENATKKLYPAYVRYDVLQYCVYSIQTLCSTLRLLSCSVADSNRLLFAVRLSHKQATFYVNLHYHPYYTLCLISRDITSQHVPFYHLSSSS